MMFAILFNACSPASAPDALPFAGVLAALDQDHDGEVTAAEYPARPTGGLPAAEVDRDQDGTISADEVRDEVYAVDPGRFDGMAWAHTGGHSAGAAPTRPPPGPLAEALVFLADLQRTRAPGTTAPTDAEIEAAAREGMTSPAGAAVLARFAAAGVAVPPELAVAAPDSPPLAPEPPAVGAPPEGTEAILSAGPGGAGAVRSAPATRPGGPRGKPVGDGVNAGASEVPDPPETPPPSP